MTDLFAARSQMAMSLGFHIIFAAVGVALPLLMVIAEALWLKTRDETYRTLAQQWAKGTAILFAVGAVSGTVLSFELGLLWPSFMDFAGAVIGFPFALEGFAFFIEAIFIGVYLYGWQRVPPAWHLFAGVMVSLSGAASAVFVVAVNGWMNAPTGFRIENGRAVDIAPIAAMFNTAWIPEAIHMTIAAYMATAFAVAGVHAFLLLRDRENFFHRRALAIALVVGGINAILQPLSGDLNARYLAREQPRKLAALEGQFKTEKGAPLRIGGLPDEKTQDTPYALEIPYGLSLLAFHDPQAVVKGLEEWPKADHPPVAVVHIAFQLMVACGMAMAAVSVAALILAWRKRSRLGRWSLPDQNWFLRTVVLASPLGFIAIEAGWTVTEVGRQPFIIADVMRTAEAVTPVPYLTVPLFTFSLVYLFLAFVVVFLLLRQFRQSPRIVRNRPSDASIGGRSDESAGAADHAR
ncbi:MAG: cytochrome ubiquinol oxidase subunit I [Candidatus Binatia bacterium]